MTLITLSRRTDPRALLLLAGLLAGCAQTKPPVAELDDAARRVNQAAEAGAATWAPTELRQAQDNLRMARAAMRSEDYEEAAWLAAETDAAADHAQASARLGKAREKVQARARENERLRGDLSSPAPAQGQEGQP